MQKVLGIDIGSYSIKVVTIESRFNESKVIDFREKIIPKVKEEDELSTRIAILKELIEDQLTEEIKVFIAMPGIMVSNRTFEFMNLKKRLLNNIIENELDGSSLFSLEHCVYDYSIVSSKAGLTRVFTVICKKDDVESLLEFARAAGINPRVVDVDYTALVNLANYIIPPPVALTKETETAPQLVKQDDILLDIGHTKTSFILIRNNKLADIHVINIGGDYFTENLKRTFGLSYEEATLLKHAKAGLLTRDISLDGESEKEKLIIQATTYIANELVNEISRHIQFLRAESGIEPRCIYLTGGGSSLNGIADYFSEQLQIPTKHLILHHQRLLFEESGWHSYPTIGQGLALALRGVPSGVKSNFNLRKGDLAISGDYDKLVNRINKVLFLVVTVLLCLGISYLVRSTLYYGHMKTFSENYRKDIVAMVGSEPRSLKNIRSKPDWTFSEYTDEASRIIYQTISEKESLLQRYGSVTSPLPLRVLRDISFSVPKDLQFEVVHFSLHEQNLTLEAETDSLLSSDKILECLRKSKLLKSVNRTSQENKAGSDGKVLRFVIEAKIVEG